MKKRSNNVWYSLNDKAGLSCKVTILTGTDKRIKNKKPAEDVKITAIPFYAWDNRPPSGEMVVWIPEEEALVENK